MLTGRGGNNMDVVVVTAGSPDHRRRRKGSSGHVVAQLLESPLPTPRRSCCGRSADTPPARRGCASSPQRGHVPFKWESSPGVPKSATAAAAGGGGKAEREVQVPPPKPPPGRCGTCHAARAHHHHSNATDSTSSDDDTLSDALERISSSDRLAALSARLSAIDGGGVFGSRRSPSFIMDRFLPAANAIATTSAEKHRPPRRSSKSGKRDWEAEVEAAARARFVMTHIGRRRALPFEHEHEQPKHPPPHRQREDAATAAAAAAAEARLPPCGKEEAQGEEMTTPRACGFMFFVPWSAKPVLLGFQRSPAAARSRSRPPRADDVDSVTITTASSSSPRRRSVTLGDVLEKDRDGGGLAHWYGEKSGGSGKEWAANPGWGMALLGTSKRYCADARKALSRLARSGTDSGDSPRVIGWERSSSKHKQAATVLRSTAVEMPPLSPPSESWLTNARRSNAGVTKVDGTCDRRESPFAHT